MILNVPIGRIVRFPDPVEVGLACRRARNLGSRLRRERSRVRQADDTDRADRERPEDLHDRFHVCVLPGGRETTRGAKWTESAKTEPSTGSSCPQGMPRPAESLARDPEKWEPVFGKDRAQTKT